MQEITYTNIFTVNGQEVNLADMTMEERAGVVNQMTIRPLETLGNIQIRRTA